MKFERPIPDKVQKARMEGDREKVVAFARAGGKANAKRVAELEMRADANRHLDEEARRIREEEMHEAAEARHDGLLPEDD